MKYSWQSLALPELRVFGEGNGIPLQYSCLENPMDGGAWWAAVHGVAKSQTRLSDLTFTFHFHALEKEMATHSSVLAWRIPGTAEPGGLPSMGSHSRTRLKWLSSSSSSSRAQGLGSPVRFGKNNGQIGQLWKQRLAYLYKRNWCGQSIFKWICLCYSIFSLYLKIQRQPPQIIKVSAEYFCKLL